MLDLILLAIGIPILALLNSHDKSNDTKLNNNTYNKENLLHKKYDNMTTYEIDEYFKRTYIDHYDGYSREYKINKIIENETNK